MAESWRSDKRKTAERGYGGKWQKARIDFLSRHPLCCMCAQMNVIRSAKVVDHKIPHQGDMKLFWDRNNWQSLCASHHSGEKQAIEKSGSPKPKIGLDGWPVPAGGVV